MTRAPRLLPDPRRLVVVLALLSAACGGSAATTAPTFTGPAVDERTAEKDARGTVTEIYGALNRGKPDNLFSSLDEQLVVFGPRRADASTTRTDALVALGKVVDAKAAEHVQLRSAQLGVVAAPGGHAAWAMDVLTVEGLPMAVLAILSSEDDFFRVTAASLALMPSAKQVRSEQARFALVPPAAEAAGGVAPGARGAVERFQKGLATPSVWGDDLGSRADAVMIGPAAGQVTRGKKAIKKLWQRRGDAQTRAALAGDITAGITVDGQLAWVTAPVTRVEGDDPPLPLRVFAVFERAGSAWRMIALQEVVAVADPGAGAPFVKLAPAPLAAPAPAPAAKPTKPTKSKPTKKAKKRRKPRRGDDE